MELKAVITPVTIQEAVKNLAEYHHIKPLAGGTDLLLDIKREKLKPDYLLDLGRIAELKEIHQDNGKIEIGSMVTFTDLIRNPLVRERFGCLFQCAKTMGSPQIRNMATVGGNIINGASAADSIPCFMVLNSTLVFKSEAEERRVDIDTYFRDIKEQIKANEILTKIIVADEAGRSSYFKLGKRNSLAIARISAALYLEAENGIIQSFRAALGAVGKVPFRVTLAETKAKGEKTESLESEEMLGILENTVYESIKTRLTMPFKKEAIKGVYKNALKELLK